MTPRGTPGFEYAGRIPSLAEVYWDTEYAQGRLLDLPPEPLVEDILSAARRFGLTHDGGLYIGVGNGRNYLPLVAGGLDLVGLDISAVGLAEIRNRAPERAHRLVHGDLGALPADARFGVVAGINVFQHGTREQAHAHVRAALDRVAPGGLFAIRVTAMGTEVTRPYQVLGEHDDGSMTIRYLPEDRDAPGITSHYFSRAGLAELLGGYDEVLPLRDDRTDRATGKRGRWRRWEAIVRRAYDF